MIIEIGGRPAPQGSKRHVGGGRMVEMSKTVGPWREAVRAETRRALNGDGPMSGPVEVIATFTMPRPRSHYRTGRFAALLRDGAPGYQSARPDVDKLLRAVLDGLTMGGLWADDGQVAKVTASKVYGPWPGCRIVARQLEGK